MSDPASDRVPKPSDDILDLKAEAVAFDPRMLEALVCPATQDRLDWDAECMELISRKAGLAYPVRGGIPIMLEGEARRLDP